MQLESFVYALFGLVIGSFLNVCIYRLPRSTSITLPRSRCPHCDTPIRPYDNIPVISYVLLRGKCRSCGESISIQYPFVELLTGLAFYACARTWGFATPTLVNSIFLSMVIVLIFIDYHHQILPNAITLPGAGLGILLSLFQAPELYGDVLSFRLAALFGSEYIRFTLPLVGSILGAVFWGGMLYIVGMGYFKLRKLQGLGMGDVKMMAMVGAFLGIRLGFMTVFSGSLLGLIFGIGLMLLGRANMRTKLAFGVFLGIGSALSLFYGLPLLRWYGQFLGP
jgi:leader peptidase (prepilin peptidase) / N-methyltransferase